MVGVGEHKLSAVAIAIIDLFFFGLGFARVFQLVQARSWRIDLRKSVIADQARYAAVLGAMVLGVIVFVLQTKALQRRPILDRLGARRRLAFVAARILRLGAALAAASPSNHSRRLPRCRLHRARTDRAASHLVPALDPLAELVLDHLRRVRDHHRRSSSGSSSRGRCSSLPPLFRRPLPNGEICWPAAPRKEPRGSPARDRRPPALPYSKVGLEPNSRSTSWNVFVVAPVTVTLGPAVKMP